MTFGSGIVSHLQWHLRLGLTLVSTQIATPIGSLSLSLSCTSVSFTSKGMPEECFLLPFLFFFFFFFSSFFVVIAPINIPYFFLLCSGNEAPPLPTAVPPPLLEYLPVLLAPLPPLALLTSQVLFPSPLQSVVQRGTPPWG